MLSMAAFWAVVARFLSISHCAMNASAFCNLRFKSRILSATLEALDSSMEMLPACWLQAGCSLEPQTGHGAPSTRCFWMMSASTKISFSNSFCCSSKSSCLRLVAAFNLSSAFVKSFSAATFAFTASLMSLSCFRIVETRFSLCGTIPRSSASLALLSWISLRPVTLGSRVRISAWTFFKPDSALVSSWVARFLRLSAVDLIPAAFFKFSSSLRISFQSGSLSTINCSASFLAFSSVAFFSRIRLNASVDVLNSPCSLTSADSSVLLRARKPCSSV